jgi:hypothetical protein
MHWQEIRTHYPHQWLLVEAITAHTEASRRVLDKLAVVNTFHDSAAAMKEYSQLHHDAPERELYVLHTSRDQLNITERKWLGIRAAP